jgi:hypothetical protein
MTQWTTPRTWVRGEIATESLLNTHVRDNLLHLKESQNTSGGSFRGVELRTHVDAALAPSRVMLLGARQIVMNDGEGIGAWPVLTADIAVSGANGLDTGVEGASKWYEIHAIRKSSDGTQALLLHEAMQWFEDEGHNTNDGFIGLRDSAVRERLSQSFEIDTASAPLVFVRMFFRKQGTPTGSMWLTVEANAAGSPSGTALATSQTIDVSQLVAAPATQGAVVFVFRTPATLVSGTIYHMVLYGDFAVSASNYVDVNQNSTDAYARGERKSYNGTVWSGSTTDLNFRLWVEPPATAVVMPTGYDQRALIGYVRNDATSKLVPFLALDRLVTPLVSQNLLLGGTVTSPSLMDVTPYLPSVATKSWWFLYLSSATGTRNMLVAPADTGYATNSTVRFGGAAVLSMSTIGGAAVGPVINKAPVVMTQVTGDAYTVLIDSWEWF